MGKGGISRLPGWRPGGQDPPGPRAEGWWCDERATATGVSRVRVLAADREEAAEKVEELLLDLGVLPGGPRGLHESFLRMCGSACRGRR